MPLVKLYSAEDSIEAHLLKHMLEQQEIPVYITGEHLESGIGELPAGGIVDVWVIDEFLADAEEVLEDFFDTLDAPDDDELMDEDGYYREDQDREDPDREDDAEDEPEPPAHDDPANPWNTVYRKK